MRIEVHVPRPILTLTLLGCLGVLLWSQGGGALLGGIGGNAPAEQTARAEKEVDHLREERIVLERRASILQQQAKLLDEEIARQEGVATAQQVRALEEARREIVALMEDQTRAERELKETLREIWEAQGVASAASLRRKGTAPDFVWPIEPKSGLSALFHDEEYEEVIGLVHQAIDIKAKQGTPVHAVADGIVTRVADNGLGYGYMVHEHEGGIATVFGHISYFYVEEGETVRKGQIVGLSGGTPGMKGSGLVSTGPHLHVEFHENGVPVDPLKFLPRYPGVPEASDEAA